MKSNLRKIEKQVDGEYVICRMKDIKKGDVFRYSEGPYLAMEDSTEENGVWGVEADEIED